MLSRLCCVAYAVEDTGVAFGLVCGCYCRCEAHWYPQGWANQLESQLTELIASHVRFQPTVSRIVIFPNSFPGGAVKLPYTITTSSWIGKGGSWKLLQCLSATFSCSLRCMCVRIPSTIRHKKRQVTYLILFGVIIMLELSVCTRFRTTDPYANISIYQFCQSNPGKGKGGCANNRVAV